MKGLTTTCGNALKLKDFQCLDAKLVKLSLAIFFRQLGHESLFSIQKGSWRAEGLVLI